MKNVLAVALVVFVASIALSQNPSPQPSTDRPTAEERSKALADEQKARAERWAKQRQTCEYKVRDLGVWDLGKGDLEALQKSLNELAMEGFELDRTVADRIGIFRRPIQQPRGLPGRLIDGRNIEN